MIYPGGDKDAFMNENREKPDENGFMAGYRERMDTRQAIAKPTKTCQKPAAMNTSSLKVEHACLETPPRVWTNKDIDRLDRERARVREYSSYQEAQKSAEEASKYSGEMDSKIREDQRRLEVTAQPAP